MTPSRKCHLLAVLAEVILCITLSTTKEVGSVEAGPPHTRLVAEHDFCIRQNLSVFPSKLCHLEPSHGNASWSWLPRGDPHPHDAAVPRSAEAPFDQLRSFDRSWLRVETGPTTVARPTALHRSVPPPPRTAVGAAGGRLLFSQAWGSRTTSWNAGGGGYARKWRIHAFNSGVWWRVNMKEE